MQGETVQSSAGLNHECQLVTFLLDEEEFAFDIMLVQEIIRLPKLAKVPRAPAYVEGIANLRGVVLPVMDLRTRFGMERTKETDRTRVLVIDIDGVKTGMKVDRVLQVTRVQRSEIEAPPSTIRGTTSAYLEGVVKLDGGKRIVMSLDAAQVCEISISRETTKAVTNPSASASAFNAGSSRPEPPSAAVAVRKLVTFRIAGEEYGLPLDHVREILRVATLNRVPDVPECVLGVLTVRGQVLPVIDLRNLLQQPSFAEEFVAGSRALRAEYERWMEQIEQTRSAKADTTAPDHLRIWLAKTNCSNQLLMETLSIARAWNEKAAKQVQPHSERGTLQDAANISRADSIVACGQEVIAALEAFEQQIRTNIQEDQRIIVVDADGTPLGLVVDHVHEVLDVPLNLIEPVPVSASAGGLELAGVARLDDGSRFILLLDLAGLIKEQRSQKTDALVPLKAPGAESQSAMEPGGTLHHLDELQLVTFMLDNEEFGIQISQIQEIDRLGKITRVPRAAKFIEGVTNLRGEVIPVLDTRKRFDLTVRKPDDLSRIIIVNLHGVRTGLIVDSVRQVLNLAVKDIAQPPRAISSGVDQQFISGIGKVDDGRRMIVLLDVERILSTPEHAPVPRDRSDDPGQTAAALHDVHAHA